MKTIEALVLDLSGLGIQIWEQDGYLSYSAPKGTMTPAVRSELTERKAEILAFLHQANLASRALVPPIKPAPPQAALPISFAQQRLWFLDQLEDQGSSYNEVQAVMLRGPLDIPGLTSVLADIVRRHAILRTSFVVQNDVPLPIVADPQPVALQIEDLQNLTPAEQTAQVQAAAGEQARRRFDLAHDSLLRVKLLWLGPTSHVFLATMHHIVTDGWSMGIFIRELSILYGAYLAGSAPTLPELPIQYADYALWQRQWLQGDVLERQIDYWRQQLAGAPAVLELPTDRRRPAVRTYSGSSEPLQLGAEQTRQIKELSQRSETTPFVTLLSVFATLLSRYSGQDDLVIGSPIANRSRPETEALIGCFANTLALRVDLRDNPQFSELIHRVRQMAVEAFAHQDTPFEKLVEELRPERDLSHSPLFQVLFVLQNTPREPVVLPDLTITPLEIEQVTAKYDLTLFFFETAEACAGILSTILICSTQRRSLA